ncbi:extracellular solute-binding protein [Actinomadura vinacea]|uniref:Extracellular solute-binding protein n=1 Tax=Actinomadura vinacea TaxID=115336 RepID=A0ABP5VER1_9ACTN
MRSRFVALLTTATTLLAAACGGGSGEGSGEKVTLTFWAWVPGIDKAVALWNQENPDVQVNVSKIPAGGDGGYQKMHSALKAGNAPDLAQLEYEEVPGFLLAGGLEDLSRHDAAQYQNRFVDWQWQQGVFGGKPYVIPQASGPMAMFYRKDLFDKWGIEPPKTWADYEKAAQEVRKRGAYISTFSPKSSGWFAGLAWQAGGQWFGTQGDTWVVDIDNPQTQQVARYWENLVRRKLVKTIPDSSNEWFRDLQEGQIATWVGASWGDAILRENAPKTAGKWRVAPMPQWQAGQNTAGNFGGSSTALLKGTKNAKEALRFAVWLNTDKESVDLLIKGGYGWPAAKGAFKGSALDQADAFFGGQRYNEVFATADQSVNKNWKWIPTFSQTAATLTDGFKGAVGGGAGAFGQVIATTDRQTVADLKSKGLQVAGR